MQNTFKIQAAKIFIVLMTSVLGVSVDALAKPPNNSIQAIPTITSLSVVNGQLVASGTVTATVQRATTTVPFSNVPVTLGLDPVQPPLASCPVLDLSLGPINVNLLGLVVTTSPICLEITANQGGGILGDLLCSVGNLLNAGLSLDQILAGQGVPTLPGLTAGDLSALLSGLTGLLNGALSSLANAILTGIDIIDARGTCAILHLELGPLDLTLLGLEVVLDNCSNGAVTVDITGKTGRGNLLGNLLCDLLGDGLNAGTTLQTILNRILSLLG